jgi:L-ascorbate metabolism protein UlaG (beta-lactamase superfamily)
VPMKAVLLLFAAAVAASGGGPDQQLTITPLGHAALRVADDQTMLLVDFPYDPGSDFTPWDRDALPQGLHGLCLVTHAHRDHCRLMQLIAGVRRTVGREAGRRCALVERV